MSLRQTEQEADGVSGHHPWPPPRKEPLPCARFYGEACDPENCCGGRDSRGRITQRLAKLIELQNLSANYEELTDDQVLELWRAGKLRVIP